MILKNCPFQVNGCTALVSAEYVSINIICITVLIKHPVAIDAKCEGWCAIHKPETVWKAKKRDGIIVDYNEVPYEPAFTKLFMDVHCSEFPNYARRYDVRKYAIAKFNPELVMTDRKVTDKQYSEALSFLLTK